jgi:hypothetical protein
MHIGDLPAFFRTISLALQLDPRIFAAIQIAPNGIWIALSVVAMAGVSEAVGQSLILFLNHIRPSRFGLAVAIATATHMVGYVLWTMAIWLAGRALFGQDQPLLAVASAVGLSYAPQIFSFFVLTPYMGNLFGVILSLWSMLAVIVAIRVGMHLEIWQAVVLASTGWILLQTMRRTIGRPVMRLQRWLASRAAGVSFDVRAQDVTRVRRRPTRTWYLQLESWRRRRTMTSAAETTLSTEGQQHVRPTS